MYKKIIFIVIVIILNIFTENSLSESDLMATEFSLTNKPWLPKTDKIEPSIEYSISTSTPTVCIFDDINILYHIKNKTLDDFPIYFEDSGIVPLTKIEVFLNNEKINFTEYGMLHEERSPFHAMSETIKSNETKNYKANRLNHFFDMSQSGIYQFQFSRLFIINRKTTTYTISNKLEIEVNDRHFKYPDAFLPPKWSKLQYDISISRLTDKKQYDNYDPIFLNIKTKNMTKKHLLMPIDTTNFFDVYNLKLKTPGFNKDFRDTKERLEGWKHEHVVKDAMLTLYGQKLFSEKNKEPNTIVTVKPDEEVAETVIVLNRIFDMSMDGIYGLIVSRKIIDENGKEQTVTSDPLPIRVGTALTQDEIDQRIKKRQEQEKTEK